MHGIYRPFRVFHHFCHQADLPLDWQSNLRTRRDPTRPLRGNTGHGVCPRHTGTRTAGHGRQWGSSDRLTRGGGCQSVVAGHQDDDNHVPPATHADLLILRVRRNEDHGDDDQ